jgi:L-alanine-DL-glutamate epimerase-like enolase superfamily enzyme
MAGELRIRDVRAAIAESPFRWVLVQVQTESGLVGTGEAWYAPGVLELLQELRGAVLGEDARDVERLTTMLTYGAQSITTEGMDWAACVVRYGIGGGAVAEGPPLMALAGFEVALWDLVGKALGTPAYTLFGGSFRKRIRMYADLHLPEEATGDSVAAALEAANEAREAGFDAVKVDADLAFPEHHRDAWNRKLANAEIERTGELVAELRASLGPAVDVAVDCHFQFGVSDAIRLATEIEPARPLWLEDPVPYGNPQTLGEVARAAGVPICFGEYVATVDRLHPYLAGGACHVIHPDVSYAGVTQVRRMASLADALALPAALHNSGGPIATVASAHVAASLRNFLVLENHNQGVPWWQDLVTWDGAKVEAGHVVLSGDAPGLGVELDRAACKRYVTDHEVLL